MGQVSFEEVEVLQQIARDATRGETFDARMTDLASALALLVPAQSITTFLLQPDGRPAHAIFWNGELETLLDYATHYRMHDPMNTSIEAAAGQPMLLSDCMGSRGFGRDPYTADLLAPLNVRWIMGATTRTPDAGRVALAIQRERSMGDFTRHERALLRLVLPDLTRAAFVAAHQERVRVEEGGVLLDARGEVREADERGRAQLRRLGADSAALLAAAVRRLLAAPTRPTGVTFVLAAEDGFVRVTATPIEGHAGGPRALARFEAVHAGSTDFFRAASAKVGLTDREREVASMALNGLGNRGIAHRLRTSESTVKFHLANVYKKTRADGRPELFHVLLGASPPG